MKDPANLIEYGQPIDAQLMVTPPDVTELELEPGHPGLGDEGYIRRRKELFAICRKHRLEGLGPPLIDYTPEETRIPPGATTFAATIAHARAKPANRIVWPAVREAVRTASSVDPPAASSSRKRDTKTSE